MRNRVNVMKKVFKVNKEKKTVVCIIECNTGIGRDNKLLGIALELDAKIRKVNNVKIHPMGEFTVLGVAKCHNEDSFDEIKGKRIAESRAKKNAYNIAYHFWKNFSKALSNFKDKCDARADACDIAEMIERNHIEELLKQ